MLNHRSMFCTLSEPLFMLSEFRFCHSCLICVYVKLKEDVCYASWHNEVVLILAYLINSGFMRVNWIRYLIW